MTVQKQRYDDVSPWEPDDGCIPDRYLNDVHDLFDTWSAVRARNSGLTRYYEMKNAAKNLGAEIPPQLRDVNAVVGWCAKAVDVRAVRSRFDGFVFDGGQSDPTLDEIARRNGLSMKVAAATRSALVHGVSMMSVMRGRAEKGQPPAVIRAFSANQACVLWDKDADDVACGLALTGVDRFGTPNGYVAHFPDSVLTFRRYGSSWTCIEEYNPAGRPLIVAIRNRPDLDKPLGHSVITPELMSITDKAVRDVIRMDIGAEFFTFPQRYALGVADDLFGADYDEEGNPIDEDAVDEDGNPVKRPVDEAKKLKAWLGSIWAITRDENGDVPQVGQFPAGDAGNFVAVYENDAQRFSGASNVPLAQLGVLSNNYTSSDALGAANDPLILDVQEFNDCAATSLETVARLAMAVAGDGTLSALTPAQNRVRAYFDDPSMPTLPARADAWTKLGSLDKDIVGTDVWYEGMGLQHATIERLNSQKRERGAIAALNAMMAPSGQVGGADGR